LPGNLLGSTSPAEVDVSFADALSGHSASPPAATAVLERPTQGDESSLKVESLKTLFELAPRAAMGEDYLLLSAYFLDHFKSQPAASMRDMNAELIRSGLTPINHAVIEAAVSKGLLELLPDTTGNALVTEYRLTPDGFSALEGLLA
jgi:hypothetical protein